MLYVLTSGEKHRESTGSFTHETLLEEHIGAMETFGTNGDVVSVWEHSLDDFNTKTRSMRRRLRICTPGKPRMASARLPDLTLCATHHHQHQSESPSDRQGQASLMRNVHGGCVRRHRREPRQTFTFGKVCNTLSQGSNTTPIRAVRRIRCQNKESQMTHGRRVAHPEGELRPV